MIEKVIPLKSLAAALYGCGPEELKGFRSLPDGSASIIAPTGQKFTYTHDELMRMDALLRSLQDRARNLVEKIKSGQAAANAELEPVPVSAGRQPPRRSKKSGAAAR